MLGNSYFDQSGMLDTSIDKNFRKGEFKQSVTSFPTISENNSSNYSLSSYDQINDPIRMTMMQTGLNVEMHASLADTKHANGKNLNKSNRFASQYK